MKKTLFRILEIFSTKRHNDTYQFKVLKGPLKGQKLFLNLSKKLESSYLLGKYDHQISINLLKIIKEDWIVWDCGTYLGFYTLFFAKNCKKVFAFEPDQVNFERTKLNLINNGYSNFELFNVAISNENGTADFIVSNNTNSHLPIGYIGSTKEEYSKTVENIQEVIKIPTKTLDTLSKELGVPNLVKIDIEGAELYAIDHMIELAQNAITSFLIESHNQQTDEKIYNFAKSHNLNIYDIETLIPINSISEAKGTILLTPASF